MEVSTRETGVREAASAESRVVGHAASGREAYFTVTYRHAL